VPGLQERAAEKLSSVLDLGDEREGKGERPRW